MARYPRLLAIMGSGETAPTMRGVHVDLLDRVRAVDGPAVMLDTPYGFQENAGELNARISEYFARNVGTPIEIASWATTERTDVDRVVERVRSARYVFAGPGSPTYALRQWRGTPLRDALTDVLRTGGCVTFASAAALTLGLSTVPVYEVYKAGLAPWWEDGLDVLSLTGLRAAVIPHYDNAEGGTHDTRFCYLGERRLSTIEGDLPDGAAVLGVDEHTACIFDLDRGVAEVRGRGGVTLRVGGRSTTFGAGEQVEVALLQRLVDGTGAVEDRPAPSTPRHRPAHGGGTRTPGTAPASTDPLGEEAQRLDRVSREAVARRDVAAAVDAVLELEQTIRDWAADTLTGDQVERARALLRGMIVRLGDLAAAGAVAPRERVAPFVEAILDARAGARRDQAYRVADRLRSALVELGIEVRDTADGVEWELSAGGR